MGPEEMKGKRKVRFLQEGREIMGYVRVGVNRKGCFNFTTEGEKEEKVKTKLWERSKGGMDDERTKDPGNACVRVLFVCGDGRTDKVSNILWNEKMK